MEDHQGHQECVDAFRHTRKQYPYISLFRCAEVTRDGEMAKLYQVYVYGGNGQVITLGVYIARCELHARLKACPLRLKDFHTLIE